MEEQTKRKYIEAGEVVQECREIAKKEAKPGNKAIDVVDAIESHIRSEGLEVAFPVNFSVNEEAAHYTPTRNEDTVIEESDIIKIDIGAHKDGYIADSALTINPDNQHREMIEEVESALESVLDFVEVGVTLSELGAHVQNQVTGNYKVVRNLTGHYIGRYTQHAGVSIPNVDNANSHQLEKGDAIAIEPFITNGAGKVKQGRKGNIYKLEEETSARGRVERQLLGVIKGYRGMPFTTRWFKEYGGREKMAMSKLTQQDIIHSYPVLKEENDGMVAQAEHTVLIGMGENGENIITTRKQ